MTEDVDVMQLLLGVEGIDVNGRAGRFRHAPLAYACDAGSEKVVELLLAHPGIDVNAGADVSCGPGPPFAALYASLSRRGCVAVPSRRLHRPKMHTGSTLGWCACARLIVRAAPGSD